MPKIQCYDQKQTSRHCIKSHSEHVRRDRTYRSHRDQDLNEESCKSVFDVLVPHLQEVLRTLLHELERCLKFLYRHHLQDEVNNEYNKRPLGYL